MARFAIGDIHGCIKTMKYLIEEKIHPSKDDVLIFLGDYIDRGPDSKAVLDYLMNMQEIVDSIYFLRGNHEEMLLDAKTGPQELFKWIFNGGDSTLKNFGITDYHVSGKGSMEDIPGKYLGFLNSTIYYLDKEPDYFFVHAGLNFETKEPLKDKTSMLWMRNPGYRDEFYKGRILVHGHTPFTEERIKASLKEAPIRIINLDAGCVYKDHPLFGKLAALDLDKMELIVVKNRE